LSAGSERGGAERGHGDEAKQRHVGGSSRQVLGAFKFTRVSLREARLR
jgi:hypothetical protein